MSRDMPLALQQYREQPATVVIMLDIALVTLAK